jgi:Na+-transporting methylmalonyl-CoA/oxaloacetate decarboxylase, gamma subunit
MTEQMTSGIELMFAGMGIVFLFLTMLVFAINIMSVLVQRFSQNYRCRKRSPALPLMLIKPWLPR